MISITTLAVRYQCLLRLFHLCFWTGGLALHVHITENPKLAVSLSAKLEFYSSWVITSFSTGTPVIRAMKQRTSSTQLLWYVQKHPSPTCKKVRWRLGYGQMRECRLSLLCTLNLKQKWNVCCANLIFARLICNCARVQPRDAERLSELLGQGRHNPTCHIISIDAFEGTSKVSRSNLLYSDYDLLPQSSALYLQSLWSLINVIILVKLLS